METTHPSIVKTLEQRAFDDPNRPAFIFVNENRERLVLTRQQVWDYSRNVAALLRKSGLEKGDVIYTALPNSPQRLMGMFGTITAGCITMAAQSCMADGSDLISSLNRGQATGIILSPSDPKGAFSILKPRLQKNDQASVEVSCQEVPTLKHIFSWTLGNWNNFLEMLEDCGKETLWHEAIDPNDVCAYMSTSGSSGVVKLVPFNSKVLMAAADQLIGTLKPTRYFCDLDLAWISGFPHVYLTQGSTRVLLDRGGNIPEDSAELQWKTAVQENCDLCFTAPKYLMEFSRVYSQSKDGVIGSYKLKRVISAGGTTTRKHARAALGKITDELIIVYGSTEGCITTRNVIKSIEEYEDFNNGFPVRNTEVKVVGLDNKEVPTGELGEIVFQTKLTLHQYVNDSENTSKTFDPDGWVRLNDVGKVNHKGQVFVMGRNQFAISKGTTVLYPEVIESMVRKCSGVKDVAIVGVPDDEMVEEMCALVVKQPDADISEQDVRAHCENVTIHDSPLIPKYFLFVDTFPVTKREKLDRVAIKRLACKMLNF